ncbi:MAG: hypothetical protein AAB252_05765, partial [Pseudomonadota bacterium]
QEEPDMLSHIVNLVNNYEHRHGIRPNLVYLNETHYGYLREEMPGVRDHHDVVNILGVDIALSDGIIHPQVATVRFAEENILVS